MPNEAIVYFDNNCQLCRSLAKFMGEHSPQHWRFVPLEPSKYGEELKLRLDYQQQSFYEEEAWSKIINLHPKLKKFAWLARSLGLSNPKRPVLYHSIRRLRKLCRSCYSRR